MPLVAPRAEGAHGDWGCRGVLPDLLRRPVAPTLREMQTVLKELAMSEEKLSLKQYVVAQKDAAERGQWLWNDITEFTEDDKELMWDLIRQLVLSEGLGEAIDGVSDAARVIRKQHPDEQTRDKARGYETTLNRLSDEVGPAFGTRE